MNTTDEILDAPEENDDNLRANRRVNQERHTETVDKLVVKNKQLQKELNDSDNVISDLEHKLDDHSIRISKTIFYVCIIALSYFMYSGNKHFADMKASLSANTAIIKEYKGELEKSRQFNELLLQRLEKISRINE